MITEVSSELKKSSLKPGGHRLMAPPGPIPNPEVKHQHVDGSRTIGPARVDSCQGKQSPQNESSAGFSVCRQSLQISTTRSVDFDQPQAGFRPARTGRISFPDKASIHKPPIIGKHKACRRAYGTSVFAAAQLRRDRKDPCSYAETGKFRATMINAAASASHSAAVQLR